MSTIRHLSHPPLPNKSTVLAGAGVQDAYWSDDEDEDAECPLCLEEMDVAEIGFKPCPCGYQICMFCYHHIKSNLNGRCPACRREYLEENVEFTAVAKEDVKRQTQQKKRKERERKELDALGRRHFANVRVVQRNVVYVVGLGSRFAKEELIPTLRSNEYFGQYGKISKIILVKRHLPGSKSPVVGLYITYHRREDAARAIHAVDGSPSPGGGDDVMRASHGTTKYCMSFLRGQNCSNNGCLDLHEWGDKNDCFTKEDLTTLKHSMKDAESQSRPSIRKKGDEHESTGLPRGTSWGQKSSVLPVSQSHSSRQSRNSNGRPRNQPPIRSSASATDGHSRPGTRGHDRRAPGHASTSSSTLTSKASGKAHSQASSSRPSTPAVPLPPPQGRPTSPAVSTVTRTRAVEPPPRSATPASSVAVESDLGSSNPDPEPPLSPVAVHSVPSAPPGLPAPPTYQLSTQAQELLDDVRARREQVTQPHVPSPFPEFDRTLDSLGGGDFSFKWTLDPKVTPSDPNAGTLEYVGSFDPFAASGSVSTLQQRGQRQFPQLSGLLVFPRPLQAPSYLLNRPVDIATGNGDGSRQESRFGFARRRASPSAGNSPSLTALASSPLTSGSPMHMYQQANGPWGYQAQQQQVQLAGVSQQSLLSPQHQHAQVYDYGHPPGVPIPSMNPLLSSPTFHPQPAGFPPGLRFQPFEHVEPDRMRTGRHRADSSDGELTVAASGPSQQLPTAFGFGGPPGLSRRDSTASTTVHTMYSEPVQRQSTPARLSGQSSHRGSSMSSTPAYASPHLSPAPDSASAKPATADPPILLATDFPALPATAPLEFQVKREQNHPYILPTPAKAPEPKVPPQPVIHVRKAQVKAKESKVTPRVQEPTVKGPPIAAPAASSGLSKATKTRTKQEKKEELQAVPEPLASTSAFAEPKKSVKIAQKPFPPPPPPEPVQAPLFSKVSKKAKPTQSKVMKVNREETAQTKSTSDDSQKEATSSTTPSQSTTPAPRQSVAEVSQNDAPMSPAIFSEPSSLTDLLDHLSRKGLDTPLLAFFNPKMLDPDSQTPLQYDPLVHALSALSVGGGSFANNLPPVSIDSAVSSFQQLLETLTQTISDLLRLLPRTTWDDSSSFDGVLRDMLKGDDFLDDIGEEGGKDDEVAALTLALERRARWMEVQLAKLEELHRDINTAAVRAVLTFNDRGWGSAGFVPRAGNSLARFEATGYVQGEAKSLRPMSLEELHRASEKAKAEERAARHDVQESVEMMRTLLPPEEE
ncbi:hypothetical protein JB92DRAFT_3114583 [Gautieria morchelliformis]|nr:hypothetical protein JB92DRAFT_3114583 [Gautieria morchelliformis]